MLNWAESTASVVLYTLAGTTALLLGVIERQRRNAAGPSVWPTFWFATGGLLLIMALGRAINVSNLMTDLGRKRARSEGWYEVRRSLQAFVVGAVAAVWAVSVAFAIWRVPERRRRYLPTAIVVFTLVCYVGIRLISLHQIDSLLSRDVRGVTIGAMIEVGLLLLAFATTAWRFRRPNSAPPDEHTEPHAQQSIETGAGRSLSP